MAFSGALTLTDLNDYLGPSQACIKPVSGKDAPLELQDDAEASAGLASTEIAIDADGEYYESTAQSSSHRQVDDVSKPRARTRLETAEISLNDCLACSGCVTSAESVLIGMQSVEELRKAISQKTTASATVVPSSEAAPQHTHFVASISPQSLASLSAKYSTSTEQPIPLRDVLRRIEYFLTSHMRFDMVLDTSFARYIALAEQAQEFRERRQAERSASTSDGPSLPMLASACPGWICYAEKTHGELIPLISKTRSPQQIAGLIAKRYVANNTAATGSVRVYHVAVMPCYDKKLEASRQDFFDDVTQSRDVDLVITTGELDDLMQAEGFDIAASLDDPMDVVPIVTPPGSDDGVSLDDARRHRLPVMLDQPGSSSGSYMFDLMKRMWMEHVEENGGTGSEVVPLRVKTIRSADYTEYVLQSIDGSGRILFKGAQCYGFRNLQNLVRKVQRQTGLRSKKAAAAALVDGSSKLGGLGARRGLTPLGRGRGMTVKRGRAAGVGRAATSEGSPLAPQSGNVAAASRVPEEDEESRGYDFVEVMACPGGCVNGGGQVRPPGQANGTASSSALTTRTITTDVTEAILDGVTQTSVHDGMDLDARINKPVTKSLDPEGYAHGWTTPPLSVVSSDGGDVLDSGMSTPMLEDPVQGWKGTSKAWVKRVEYTYWAALGGGGDGYDARPSDMVTSVHQAQAQGVPRDDISASVGQALNVAAEVARDSERCAELDRLVDSVVEVICQDKTARSALLRTQYRALQDEAVSGLAVQW